MERTKPTLMLRFTFHMLTSHLDSLGIDDPITGALIDEMFVELDDMDEKVYQAYGLNFDEEGPGNPEDIYDTY